MDINELKVGGVLLIDDEVYVVVELLFNESGVKVTLENIATKEVVDKVIDSENSVECITLETKKMQFSYVDGNLYYFMDIESMQQLPLTYDMVKNHMKYIKEDSIVTMTLGRDKLISIEPNEIVELVVESIKEVRGGYNIAVLETGLEIKVPDYVLTGDTIKINTKKDSFVERI